MLQKLSPRYWAGKYVVHLHYKRKVDLYSLPQEHAPELWFKSQNKAKIKGNTRWAVWRRDNFTCVYCDAWGQSLSLDHVVPEVHGGSAEMDNLVTACAKCNMKKGNMDFDQFMTSKWLEKKRRQHSSTMGIQYKDPMDLRREILERIGRSPS